MKNILILKSNINMAFRFFIFLIIFPFTNLFGQKWVSMMQNPNSNFYETRTEFNHYWDSIKIANPNLQKRVGYNNFKRWEYTVLPFVNDSGKIESSENQYYNYLNYLADNHLTTPKGWKTNPSNNSNNYSANYPVVTPNGNWSELGPDTSNYGIGKINSITFHPSDTNTFFICSAGGGLWKTNNGGQTWSTNTDFLNNLGCSSLAINPQNPNTMYLATGNVNTSPNSIGILKSFDGGNTWATTGLVYNGNINKVLIDPIDTSKIYCATKTQGLKVSFNSGTTWLTKISGNISDLQINEINPNTVYAILTNGTFYKSTNGGNTFYSSTNGLPSTTLVGRSKLSVSKIDTNIIYIVNSTVYANGSGLQGVYTSNNGGISFTTCIVNFPNILGYDTLSSVGQAWYNQALVVSDINPSKLFVAGNYVYQSLNSGMNWTKITGTYHVDIHDLFMNNGHLYISCDGGLYRINKYNNNIETLNSNLGISQMYKLGCSPYNKYKILTGHQDNGTKMYKNGSWNFVAGGDGMEAIFDFTDTSIFYLSAQTGGIYKMVNNFMTPICSVGQSSGINSTGAWITPFTLNPLNHNTIYVGKDSLYKSVDGGSTFNSTGNFSNWNLSYKINSIKIANSDSNYIYVSTFNKLYVSTDGINFIDRTPFTQFSGYYVDFTVSDTDPNKIWICYDRATGGSWRVLFSNNAGVTWVDYSQGLPTNTPFSTIIYQKNVNDGLYIGSTYSGVFYRDSTINSWIPFFNNLPNVRVTELEINYLSGKLRASTYGRGLWESDLYTYPPPNGDFSFSKDTLCIGDTLTFYNHSTDGPFISFNWNFGTSAFPSFSSTDTSQIVSFSSSGIKNIYLFVTGPGGTDTVVKQIIVLPLPTISITTIPNDTICIGTAITLIANGANTYSWTGGITNAMPFTPNSSNTFTVTATDSNGCINTNTASITINPLPNISIATIPNDTVCLGTAITLTASGANTYSWSGGITNAMPFTPNSSNTFTVTATDSNGCINTNTASITINPLPIISVSALPYDTLCLGSAITLTANGASTYSWTGGITNAIAFTPTTSNTFTITATDSNGCITTNTISIIVNQLPNVSITTMPNDTVCNGDIVTLNATGTATNYIWSGGITNNTSFTPINSTTYTVTGTDANNCSITSTINLTVTPNTIPSVNLTSTSSTVSNGQYVSYQANVLPTSVQDYILSWFVNGTLISSTQFPVDTFGYIASHSADTVCVRLIPLNGCYSPDTVMSNCLSLANVTSVTDISTNSNIKVYPNPVDDKLNIELIDFQNTSIKLIDLFGNVVITQKLKSNKTQIQTTSFAKGLYNLEILSNGKMYNKKVIIQ